MSITINNGTFINDVIVGDTKIDYIQVGSSYMWARPAEITFKLAWTKFSSWTISRVSSKEPSAQLGSVASSATHLNFADGGELKIPGYYGDTYRLTRTAIDGWADLIADRYEFTVDPDFTLEHTTANSIKLNPPAINLTRSGANVVASVTNTNDSPCYLVCNCFLSEYNHKGVYKYGHYNNLDSTQTTSTVAKGTTVTFTWKTNENGADCTYAQVWAWCKGANMMGFTASDSVTAETGTAQNPSVPGGGGGGGGVVNSNPRQ